MTAQDMIRTGGLVFLAVTLVVLGDTFGKLLTAQGVHPFIIAWTRFVLGALLFLPISGVRLPDLRILLDWRVLARGALIAGGICSILTALRTEPIANVFGAFFIGPIISYVLAVIFLRERPSTLQSTLLFVGFAGVMLVVKPGFGATTGIFFALLAGVFYGTYLFATKALAGAYRPRVLLLSQLLVGSVLIAPMGLTSPAPDLSFGTTALLIGSALGSTAGNYLLIIANRTASASLVAPLVYTQLISATAMGLIVFGDWPDTLALLGLILIAGAGFGSLLAQRR